MKTNRKRFCGIFCGFSLMIMSAAPAQHIEVKAYQTRLSDLMQDIGQQSRRKIVLNTDQNPQVSFGSKESSLEETLKKLENLYGFRFEVTDGEIIVNDKVKGTRGLATSDESGDPNDPVNLRQSGFRFRSINMNFQEPATVVKQVKNILGDNIRFLDTDEKNKAVVFYGDDATYRLVRQIVEDVDVAAPQILLGARVVEVTESFARDLGVSLSRQAGLNGGNISMPNLGLGENFVGGYKFGIIDAVGITADLNAGESNGDAKTISNPQVITSDDVAANLDSGLTYSVRVNSAGGDSGGGTTGVVAGGLEKVTAGLKMEVTPKLLRDGRIRLKLNIDNSQVDKGSSVDNIPGITNTSVKTELVIRSGQTAAIAGLYKYTDDSGQSGVPLAMHVPLLGWLFKKSTKAKTRQEVMAFITPAVLDQLNERSISVVRDPEDKVMSPGKKRSLK